MYQFFVPRGQVDEAAHRVLITGSDVNHIRNVLRMRVGEELDIRCLPEEGSEDREITYRCAILEPSEEEILCEIRFVRESDCELPVRVTLFQCLPKGDKLETVIQKCVELGVSEVVPVASKRCVVKLDEKKASAKVTRWQGIAEAAAKQSKRSRIPKVSEVVTFKEAVKRVSEAREKASAQEIPCLAILPYELAGEVTNMDRTRELFSAFASSIRETSREGEVFIFIGPEGGFEETEVSLAREAGICPVSLGPRILRTETAGMTVLAWLGYLLDR